MSQTHHDCAFCQTKDLATEPVNIGSVSGFACPGCAEGLALVVARYSVKRAKEAERRRNDLRSARELVAKLESESLPVARKERAA